MPTESFLDELAGGFVFNLYGYPLKDLTLNVAAATGGASAGLGAAGIDPNVLGFASIITVSGASGCAKLEPPMILLIPTTSKVLTEEECGLKPDKKLQKWILPIDLKTLRLGTKTGGIGDLVCDSLPEIQGGPDGGIRLSNPRIVDGKACVTVHVWAKWKKCVHIPWDGDKCVTIVDVDDTRDVCVRMEGCQDVYSIGPVVISLCFSAPRQLCAAARISVDGWGGEIGRYCVDLPIPLAVESRGCECGKTN